MDKKFQTIRVNIDRGDDGREYRAFVKGKEMELGGAQGRNEAEAIGFLIMYNTRARHALGIKMSKRVLPQIPRNRKKSK